MRDQYWGTHTPDGTTNKFTYAASYRTSGDRISWHATVTLGERSWPVEGHVAMINGLANVDPVPIVHAEVKSRINQIQV